MIKVSAQDWMRIVELQKRQDYHAFSLGALRLEYLKNRGALLVQSSNKLVELGALEVEHERHQKFWMDKVLETEARQRLAGEEALKNVGINPSSGTFTILESVVHVLYKGEWLPLELEQT